MLKKDHFAIGLLLGAISPLLTWGFFFYLGSYYIFISDEGILFTMYQNKNMFYILSCFINLLILRYYTRKEYEQTPRGIVGITMVCAIIFFVYKNFFQNP